MDFIFLMYVPLMSKRIELYYDSLSPIYDQATAQFGWEAPQRLAEVCKIYSKNGLGHVLDIGCGTWQVVEALDAEYILYTDYVGIDISDHMLAVAKQKFPNRSFIHGDIETTALKDMVFSTVLAIGEFIEDFAWFISKVRAFLEVWWLFIFTFENYIPDHPLQSAKQSSTWPWIADFPTFRYTLEEVQGFLKDAFDILGREGFIGYYKTNQKIPLYYTIVVAQADYSL